MISSSHQASATPSLQEILRKKLRIKKFCTPRLRARDRDMSSIQPIECPTAVRLENLSSINAEASTSHKAESMNQDGSTKRLEKTSKGAISKIEAALRTLKGVTVDMFPQFAATLDDIVACIHRVQVAGNYSDDYNSLNAQFETMSKTLNAIISELEYDSEDKKRGLLCLAQSVDDKTSQLSRNKTRGKAFHVFTAKRHEAYVMECHHQIRTWLLQLQAQTNFIMIQDSRTHLRITLLQRLFPAEYSKYSEVAKRGSDVQGTAIDILEGINEWALSDSSSKVYWMTGAAGTGKTATAYSVAKWFDEQNQLGASFFCSADSASCNDPNRIVPTIAYQLAQYSRKFQHSLCQILEDDPDVRTLGVEKQLNALIVGLLGDPIANQRAAIKKNTVIVIDGLDKCRDQNTVGLMVRRLLQHSVSLPFKIFLTSRSTPCSHNISSTLKEISDLLQLHSISDPVTAEGASLSRTQRPCERNMPLNHVGSTILDRPQNSVEQNILETPLVQKLHNGVRLNAEGTWASLATGTHKTPLTQEPWPYSNLNTRISSRIIPSQHLAYSGSLDSGLPVMNSLSLDSSRIQPHSGCSLGDSHIPSSFENWHSEYQDSAFKIHSVKSETHVRRSSIYPPRRKKCFPMFLMNALVIILMVKTTAFTPCIHGALPPAGIPHSPRLDKPTSLSTLSLTQTQTQIKMHIEAPVSIQPAKAKGPEVMMPIHALKASNLPAENRVCSVINFTGGSFNAAGSSPIILPETTKAAVFRPSGAMFPERVIHYVHSSTRPSISIGTMSTAWLLELVINQRHQNSITSKNHTAVISSREYVKYAIDTVHGPTPMSCDFRKLAGRLGLPICIAQSLRRFPDSFRLSLIRMLEVKLRILLDYHLPAAAALANLPIPWDLDISTFKFIEILQTQRVALASAVHKSYIQFMSSGFSDMTRVPRGRAQTWRRTEAPFGTNSTSHEAKNAWALCDKNDSLRMLLGSSADDYQHRTGKATLLSVDFTDKWLTWRGHDLIPTCVFSAEHQNGCFISEKECISDQASRVQAKKLVQSRTWYSSSRLIYEFRGFDKHHGIDVTGSQSLGYQQRENSWKIETFRTPETRDRM